MNYRTRTLLIGGVMGALAGVLAGWLYFNSNVKVDEAGKEQLSVPSAGDALKFGLSFIGLLRLITG
ncbi:MAG TPA: hypothetical protein PLH19_04910 [Anaerolineae bacterium]|nr:hypothetical protein [Anaerolineae bacterium]HQH37864.1 hypothetical protein [Anaerolineae bacterium]